MLFRSTAKPKAHFLEDPYDNLKEGFEQIEESLHPAAAQVLKHIKPEHHDIYKPYLEQNVFNGSYKDRADVLKAAERAGHTVKEETEDQHYCAQHVYSEVFGEGLVVEGQHAEPDENGNIEWYTVQFDHGEEVIFTEDVEVMMAEYHNNHTPSKKKAKKTKE